MAVLGVLTYGLSPYINTQHTGQAVILPTPYSGGGGNISNHTFSLAAEACPQAGTTALICSGMLTDDLITLPTNIADPIALRSDELLGVGVLECERRFVFAFDLVAGQPAPSNLPTTFTTSFGLDTCSMTITRRTPSDLDLTIIQTIKLPGATFGVIDNDAKTTAILGSENADIKGSVTGEVVTTLTQDENWQKPFSPGVLFTFSNIKGSFDGQFVFNLDGTENLSENFAASGFANVVIDQSRSTWTSDMSGKVSGSMAYTWQADNSNLVSQSKEIVQFTRLSFCTTACDITYSEKQEIYATKQALGDDPISGTIYSYQEHSEHYSGTGIGDPKAGTIKWNTDVTVTKDDTRKWTHDFKCTDKRCDFNEASAGTWQWNGNVHSTALLKPFQNNYSKTVTDTDKSVTFSCTKGVNCDVTWSGSAFKKEHDPGSGMACPPDFPKCPITYSNTRSGTAGYGQSGIDARGQSWSSFMKGVYNQVEPRLLVTDSSDISLKGKRVDDGIIWIGPSNLYSSYFHDIAVPGYFTVGTVQEAPTFMETKPKKLVPGRIKVFKSWSSSEDSLFVPEFQKIKAVLDQAAALGTTVLYEDTYDPDHFRHELDALSNGDMLINIGHGSPVGLYAGVADDKNLIPYPEIETSLHKNQVSLVAFAANSCYSGRAPISLLVIGPLNAGIFSNASGGLTNQIKVGSHSINQVIDDLVQQIADRLGVSSCAGTNK